MSCNNVRSNMRPISLRYVFFSLNFLLICMHLIYNISIFNNVILFISFWLCLIVNNIQHEQ